MSDKVPLREKHAAETRIRIVAEALACFLEQGYNATTVDEIAARADVSPRTFFRYFPTKEALLFADFEERLAGIRAQIRARPVDEPPGRTVVAVLCAAIDELEDDPGKRTLLLELVRERPALLAYQRATVADRAEGEMCAALAERSGLDPSDLGLRAMVAAVAACHHVALTDWIAAGALDRFEATFLRTIEACGPLFPDPSCWPDRAGLR